VVMNNGTPARRPGGRSARVRSAVLAAARQQLVSHGYASLNVRDVAREAGVAPTTVYRHWPTVADLAAAAMGDLVGMSDTIPDTGSLAGDLGALLAKVARLLRHPEILQFLRALIALDDSTPSAAELRRTFWRSRVTGASVIVDRAIARGELAPDTDADTLLESLIAPIYLRRLLSLGASDDDLLERSVRAALVIHGTQRQGSTVP
jgi:AcrR family transcriptional regulator